MPRPSKEVRLRREAEAKVQEQEQIIAGLRRDLDGASRRSESERKARDALQVQVHRLSIANRENEKRLNAYARQFADLAVAYGQDTNSEDAGHDVGFGSIGGMLQSLFNSTEDMSIETMLTNRGVKLPALKGN